MGVFPVALQQNLRLDLIDAGIDPQLLDQDVCPIYPGDASGRSLWLSVDKKFCSSVSPNADQKALQKFLDCNLRSKSWVLQLETEDDQVLFGELKRAIYDFWNPSGLPLMSSAFDALSLGRLGPGASIGAHGTSFYAKLFSSPLTCTSHSLYEQYRAYTRNYPEWSNAEIIRHEHYGSPRIVEGNRLSFVPKTKDISRTICTEPTLNMFLQLGIANILESRLKQTYHIDMALQPFKNRELARLGSIHGNYFTIDLESASDSLSLNMLRSVLPSDMLRVLTSVRSPVSRVEPDTHELHMISTMGNGYTFPLQTILFTCVVHAAFRFLSIIPDRPKKCNLGNFGVFGDDIIGPIEIYEPVCRLLHLLGFRVNAAKSFAEGPFRESCGGDFFLGRNIRGVYLKKLDTKQDYYVAINRFNQFSAMTGIILNRVVRWLLARVPKVFVPPYENDDAGIKIPLSLLEKKSYNKDVQGINYLAYIPVPLRYRVLDGRIIGPRRLRRLIYNPSGLLISILHGTVASGYISVRDDRVKYRTKRRSTSFWDAEGTISPLQRREFDWRRWESAVYFNHFD